MYNGPLPSDFQEDYRVEKRKTKKCSTRKKQASADSAEQRRTFTPDEKVLLATLYREHECLWNIRIAAYHNRAMRDAAYSEIASKVSTPDAPVDAKVVKQQLNALRNQFLTAHAKVTEELPTGSAADEDGKARTRHWWLHDELLFLADTVKCRQTRSNVRTHAFKCTI